jgi:predicted nucleotidyltransferase
MENDIRKRLHVLFASEVHISLAYLFGSQVTGDVGPMSDYDFGILVDPDVDLASLRARVMHELTLVLGTDRVDIVPLNQAPLALAHAIMAEGVVLYQRDTATRVEYEAEVMSRYGDYLPVMRSMNADIVRGDRNTKRIQRYREALRRTERTLSEIKAAQK